MTEIEGRRAGDDATDAEVEEVLSVAALAPGIAKAVAEHHLVAARLRRHLDRPRHGTMERVGDRRHEQPDHRREPGLQLARR